jgi:hypothetical protein
MLTKKEVLALFDQSLRLPRCINSQTIVHVIDLSGNPFAPEKIAYTISYVCSVFKARNQVTFYPNTVGIQGRSKLKGSLLK